LKFEVGRTGLRNKKPPRKIGTVQFGVILKQPAAGQAKEKFFLSTNFSSAAGETE
jgi:hypothetical protein